MGWKCIPKYNNQSNIYSPQMALGLLCLSLLLGVMPFLL